MEKQKRIIIFQHPKQEHGDPFWPNCWSNPEKEGKETAQGIADIHRGQLEFCLALIRGPLPPSGTDLIVMVGASSLVDGELPIYSADGVRFWYRVQSWRQDKTFRENVDTLRTFSEKVWKEEYFLDKVKHEGTLIFNFIQEIASQLEPDTDVVGIALRGIIDAGVIAACCQLSQHTEEEELWKEEIGAHQGFAGGDGVIFIFDSSNKLQNVEELRLFTGNVNFHEK